MSVMTFCTVSRTAEPYTLLNFICPKEKERSKSEEIQKRKIIALIDQLLHFRNPDSAVGGTKKETSLDVLMRATQ